MGLRRAYLGISAAHNQAWLLAHPAEKERIPECMPILVSQKLSRVIAFHKEFCVYYEKQILGNSTPMRDIATDPYLLEEVAGILDRRLNTKLLVGLMPQAPPNEFPWMADTRTLIRWAIENYPGLNKPWQRWLGEKVVFVPSPLFKFACYEQVRMSGKFNMYEPGARGATGLSRDDYREVMEHYDAYAKKYPGVVAHQSKRRIYVKNGDTFVYYGALADSAEVDGRRSSDEEGDSGV